MFPLLSHFSRRFIPLAAALLAFAVAGCASARKKDPGTQAAATQRVHTVGKVATVNETLGFVLIDAVEVLQPGTPLRTITPATRMETGTLSVSPEQSRPFYIGEIGSGKPQRGDWVVRVGTAVAATTTTSETTITPEIPHVPAVLPDELPPLPESFGETSGPALSAPVSDSAPPPAPAAPAAPAPTSPSLPEFPPLPPIPEPSKSAFD